MDSPFPFGFPTPTALYLLLYVTTFAVHQFFMHCVLAGSIYLGWCSLAPGQGVARGDQALANIVRDWLPFMLSAAITAGVAPLLFIQIVYPIHFYTANLLLSWKWMIVVPILIFAFYLLYVQKSSLIKRWPNFAQVLVTLIGAGCFVFVGFCWTANHMLGNAEAEWATIYATGQLGLDVNALIARMLIWGSAAFATFAVVSAWQLRSDPQASKTDLDRVKRMGMGGVIASLIASLLYCYLLDESARTLLMQAFGAPYVAIAVGGGIIQLFVWGTANTGTANTGTTNSGGNISTRHLVGLSAGLLLSLIGASVTREVLRLAELDITQLYDRHAESASVGGHTVFIAFALINACLIAFCIWTVAKGKQQAGPDRASC